MKPRTYTDQDFIDAVASSVSIRQVLSKLGLKEAGGNYHSAKKRISTLGIDSSHLTGQASSKGRYLGPRRATEDYLSNKFSVNSHSLRLRLIKEGYFEHRCCRCCLTVWQDQIIPLELEHKDGNHSNNSLDNLELLCPNCHALTPTYRGRNVKR